MDTAAFIVALLVIVAVGYWYIENELRKSDGAYGLFAVRQAEKPRKAKPARFSEGAARYRARGSAAADDAPATDSTAPPPAQKYRAKERAWDRAARLGDAE
ncbi:MAG: hypothetical protein U5J99_14250 [Parvularculaceae bacterium]|nr:hypothetical protein [Parvularculaceae bacterium]